MDAPAPAPAPLTSREKVARLLAEHAPTAAGTDVWCTCFNWKYGENWMEHILNALDALTFPDDTDR